MKVIVYAICKNEENFVDRWYNSMKEADEIYVLDTGSTDDTVNKLENLGVNVKSETIIPWRFDEARNKSLDMVPMDADICVCTDLDEIFNTGWRKTLEDKFGNACRCKYDYIWSFDKYGNPAVNFYQEKIHVRNGYSWVNAVHEVLKCNLDNEKVITIDGITLKHYPDCKKSRGSYLPLLELAVKEDPDNDRNMHYLGREYMYYNRYDDAIYTLRKHLEMKNSKWDAERCASLRFISRCYKLKGNFDLAIKYGLLSIAECPYFREPYLETAFAYYVKGNFDYALYYLKLCLLINGNSKIYINEPMCYDGTAEDLAAVCEYYLGNYNSALEYVNKALLIDPENERIIKNKELILLKVD